MKTKEEIEQLAEQYTQDGIYLSDSEKQQTEIAYMTGYTQCQENMVNKRYTEEDIKMAIELARETESVRRGALSEDWDDIEKYDEMDIIYLLNKQD
jgi:hypothetical protein